MKYDDLISYIGDFGTYQKRVYALVCIPAITIGMQAMATVFTLGFPAHRCAVPGVTNDSYSIPRERYDMLNVSLHGEDAHEADPSCYVMSPTPNDDNSSARAYQLSPCHEWVYDDSTFKSSVVTEFDLVCEKKMAKTHIQMFYMLGSLFGAIFLGPPADVLGRKKILVICILLHIIAAFAVAVTPNVIFLCAAMFVNGGAAMSLYIVTFVVGMELVGPKKRLYTGYIIVMFFGLGVLVLPLLAYFLRDWTHLQLAISSITVIYLAYPWLLPESPRWLISKGRYSEAEKILRKAARVNGTELPSKAFQWESMSAGDGGAIEHEHLWKIFKYPRLMFRTFVIFFNW